MSFKLVDLKRLKYAREKAVKYEKKSRGTSQNKG